MTTRFKPGNTSNQGADVILNAWAVWVKNAFGISSAIGWPGQYYSPDDCDAAFTTATTLTITNAHVALTTQRLIGIVVTRLDGSRTVYDADGYPMTFAAGVVTCATATFLATDIAYKVIYYGQVKGVGVVGEATADHMTVVGGTDGTFNRHWYVNAAGQGSTRDDNVTGTADAAAPSQGYQVGGRAYAGNPVPVSANDDFVRALFTLLGQMRVYMDSALNRTNDEVKNEDIPPPEIVAGGPTPTSATAEHTLQLTATSAQLKLGVFIMIDPLRAAPAGAAIEVFGAHYTSADHSIINGGACIAGQYGRSTSLLEGNHRTVVFIKIDDPSKVYVAGNIASIPLVWQAI